MNLKEYLAQIEAWKMIYGEPKTVINTDPTTIRAACDRCGKIRKKMHRHHISHDFMFATIRPDLYAKRYISFDPADVRRLCAGCHRAVHHAYDSVLARCHRELAALRGTPTKVWCEKWRAVFRMEYENWRKQWHTRKSLKAKKKSS